MSSPRESKTKDVLKQEGKQRPFLSVSSVTGCRWYHHRLRRRAPCLYGYDAWHDAPQIIIY